MLSCQNTRHCKNMLHPTMDLQCSTTRAQATEGSSLKLNFLERGGSLVRPVPSPPRWPGLLLLASPFNHRPVRPGSSDTSVISIARSGPSVISGARFGDYFRVLNTRAFPGRSNSRRFAGKVSVSRGWSFTLPLESERLVFYPTPRIRGVGAANLSVSRGWSFTLPLESERLVFYPTPRIRGIGRPRGKALISRVAEFSNSFRFP